MEKGNNGKIAATNLKAAKSPFLSVRIPAAAGVFLHDLAMSDV